MKHMMKVRNISVTKNKLILFLVCITFYINGFAGDLPDPNISPWAVNLKITQDNIHETICVKGYSKTVRPPTWYTNKLNKIQIKQYGYADTDPRDYEQDHVVPISLAGDPTDPENEYPQPRNSEWNAGKKDKLELRLLSLVCHGNLPLSTAQHDIAADWIEAYKKYGGKKYHGDDY